MTTFDVNPDKLKQYALNERNLAFQLRSLKYQANACGNQLSTAVSVSNYNVKKNLSNLTNQLNTYIKSIDKMADVLNGTAYLYSMTEKAIRGSRVSIKEPETAKDINEGISWLGYEFDEDNPGVTAWIGKVSAETKSDSVYAGVNGYLGKAEAEVKAEAGFMKEKTEREYRNGKWIEKESMELLMAEVGGGVAASALAGDLSIGAGDDMLGVEGKIEGTVGTVKAEAKGKFSVGEDGFNLNVKGEAMVSAVEGEATGTINILGIEIKGKVGGYAGAIGVEGKAGFEDNKFVIEGGAAALFGGSFGLEIGVNDEGWDNFVDFVTFWD